MSKLIDLTGKVFGRLTVVERAENNKWGNTRWKCTCTCGVERFVHGGDLKSKKTSSCGCYNKETRAARATTHGLKKNPWYSKAQNIKARITNPKDPSFHNYGGRGLLLYEPWHDVGVFAADLIKMFGEFPPSKESGLSIDRIDNEKGYFPDNLRLTDRTTQNMNQRPRKGGTSKFRGVWWVKREQKWVARVNYQKKHHYIGSYTTEQEAAQARDQFILKNKWPHTLNFPNNE